MKRHLTSTDTALQRGLEAAIEEYFAEQVAAGKVTFDEATGEYRSVDLHRGEEGAR